AIRLRFTGAPPATRQSAFAACSSGLFRGKLMGSPFGMGSPSALTRNLALLFRIHGCKSTSTASGLFIAGHVFLLMFNAWIVEISHQTNTRFWLIMRLLADGVQFATRRCSS